LPTALTLLVLAAALGQIAAADHVDTSALVTQLGSVDAADRDAAEAELGKLGIAAFPALFDATCDEDPERSRRANRLISRLDKAALKPLRALTVEEDEQRAERASLLLSGIIDRIAEGHRRDLLRRLQAVGEAELVTASEQRSWEQQILRQKFMVDDHGNPLPTPISLRLAGRELIPDGSDEQRAPDADVLVRFRKTGELPDERFKAAWESCVAMVGDGADQRTLFGGMISAEPAMMESASRALAAGHTASAPGWLPAVCSTCVRPSSFVITTRATGV